jgi:hypothetical protein
MLPEARAYLDDIEQATALIDQFRQGKTFDDYLSTSCFVRAWSGSWRHRRGRKQAVAN